MHTIAYARARRVKVPPPHPRPAVSSVSVSLISRSPSKSMGYGRMAVWAIKIWFSFVVLCVSLASNHQMVFYYLNGRARPLAAFNGNDSDNLADHQFIDDISRFQFACNYKQRRFDHIRLHNRRK